MYRCRDSHLVDILGLSECNYCAVSKMEIEMYLYSGASSLNIRPWGCLKIAELWFLCRTLTSGNPCYIPSQVRTSSVWIEKVGRLWWENLMEVSTLYWTALRNLEGSESAEYCNSLDVLAVRPWVYLASNIWCVYIQYAVTLP